MKLVAIWSGGKDCYTACHKAMEQGHEVAVLLTFKYMDPYIFHSFLITKLQSKALRIPQEIIEMPSQVVPNKYVDIQEPIARLKKQEGIEGIVTGDIDSTRHKPMWDKLCADLGLKLLTPIWDWPGHTYPGIRYRERVLEMELSTGMKAIINCIDQKYFGEEWLGREFNKASVEEMKSKVGPAGTGIDATGEFGEFHTTVLDSPFFKEQIEITKFSKERRVTDHGGLPPTGDFLYMKIEEAVLKPKTS